MNDRTICNFQLIELFSKNTEHVQNVLLLYILINQYVNSGWVTQQNHPLLILCFKW